MEAKSRFHINKETVELRSGGSQKGKRGARIEVGKPVPISSYTGELRFNVLYVVG